MIDQYLSRLDAFSLSCALCPRNACHILTCPWNSGPLLYNSSFSLLDSRRQDASWRRIQPDILEHERSTDHTTWLCGPRYQVSVLVHCLYSIHDPPGSLSSRASSAIFIHTRSAPYCALQSTWLLTSPSFLSRRTPRRRRRQRPRYPR